MSEFFTVAKIGEIPQGEGRAFEVEDKIIAVFNDGGTYRAIDDMCPHMGASLAAGWLEDSAVACPWHGWRFDIRDGAWCENRRLKIDVYDVRVEGEEIQVQLPAQGSDEPKDSSNVESGPADASDASGSDEASPCDRCQPPSDPSD